LQCDAEKREKERERKNKREKEIKEREREISHDSTVSYSRRHSVIKAMFVYTVLATIAGF
jgi:hypothetical protein